jgi:dUTP pyrophosphatase
LELEKMILKVKKITPYAHTPTKNKKSDAAFDLYAIGDNVVPKGGTKLIHTGICLEIEQGFFGKIESRSSLAKKGLFCTAGVIDSGYRGEVMIVLNNRSNEDYHVSHGHRVAQLIIHKTEPVELTVVDDLDRKNDRGGGFGSSGK